MSGGGGPGAHVAGDTTWYRERREPSARAGGWPILWRAWVAPGRRNAR
jgi:hypothetical protein